MNCSHLLKYCVPESEEKQRVIRLLEYSFFSSVVAGGQKILTICHIKYTVTGVF